MSQSNDGFRALKPSKPRTPSEPFLSQNQDAPLVSVFEDLSCFLIKEMDDAFGVTRSELHGAFSAVCCRLEGLVQSNSRTISTIIDRTDDLAAKVTSLDAKVDRLIEKMESSFSKINLTDCLPKSPSEPSIPSNSDPKVDPRFEPSSLCADDSPPTSGPSENTTPHVDRRSRVLRETRERRWLENLCLYCGGDGHKIRACPIRPSRPFSPSGDC